MVASIESLLKDPRMAGADQLVLQAGKNPTVINSSGATDLGRAQLSPFDIFKLLSPIIPEDKKAALMSQPTTQFQVNVTGAGQFDVVVSKEGGAMKVIFKPLGGTPASVPPPSPPAPPTAPLRQATPSPFTPPSPPAGMSPVVSSIPTPNAPPPYRPLPPPMMAAPTPSQNVSLPPERTHTSSPGISRSAAPAPGVQLRKRGPLEIDKLFHKQLEMKASDLHLSAANPPMVRHDGDIVPMGLEGYTDPLTSEDTERILWELMPDKNREEFNRRHDTDFAYELGELARFRCNIFMDRKGMGGVFRQIPNKIMTAEAMGLSPELLKLCFLTKGLVLVTGPTGSGKSTTLCAMIDYVNRNRSDHIITIEDPIEFVHENKKCLLNQREVHNHTDSFKDALRAALREDPDVILVGELRDLETIAIAIETAETGHLVFGTLHTSSAPSTIDRVIDQFPADRQAQIRVMLAESLKGVISQVLCKKKGGGRVPALEILICTSAIANLIREGKTFQIPSAMQTGKLSGMMMMNDALFDLIRKRLIEPQEAYVKAVDKTGFEAMLKRNNVDTSFLTPASLIPPTTPAG